MTHHTPGPWSVVDGEIEAEGAAVASVDRHELNPACVDAEANARLIAAAPELLEALDYLYNWTKDVGGDEAFHDWRRRAAAAIAKATGETP
jgi:hypothetical protein